MPPRDEFYQARSQFQVGAFQAAINTLNSLASGAQEIKLMLLYRCYLAQKKQSIVLSELGSITSASPAELQAVKLLAEIQSQPGHNNTLTSKLRDLAHGNQSNGPVCYIAAEVFASSGQLEEAMRILHPIVDIDLDCACLMVECFLKLNRVDLAQASLNKMKDQAEDAVSTQLAEAWISLYAGGDKSQDAFYIYQELIETFGMTSRLLVGQAISYINMAKFQEAEALLLDALKKNGEDPEALANLVVCARQLGRSHEVTGRYMTSLKSSSPNHPLFVDLDTKAALFDRLDSKFAQ